MSIHFIHVHVALQIRRICLFSCISHLFIDDIYQCNPKCVCFILTFNIHNGGSIDAVFLLEWGGWIYNVSFFLKIVFVSFCSLFKSQQSFRFNEQGLRQHSVLLIHNIHWKPTGTTTGVGTTFIHLPLHSQLKTEPNSLR